MTLHPFLAWYCKSRHFPWMPIFLCGHILSCSCFRLIAATYADGSALVYHIILWKFKWFNLRYHLFFRMFFTLSAWCCSQVDPIVASFSGGAVGVISALMVVEINNVKQQEHKRCKYCLGTGKVLKMSHYANVALFWNRLSLR